MDKYAIARNFEEMVEKKGMRGKVLDKTNEDFERRPKQMWGGIKGVRGKQAGEADTGIATSREQNGKMTSGLKGKRGVTRRALPQAIGTQPTNKTFDAECAKEIDARGVSNVDASEREDSGSERVAERVHTGRSKEVCS